jgi:rhodanese-related sulfurtransferase
LHKAIVAKEPLSLYSVNSVGRYNKGHVPGAQWLNRHGMNASSLPQDKTSKIVFYCGSPRCKASHKAASKASRMGYTNVWVMPEGIKGWEEANLPTETGAVIDPVKRLTAAELNSKRQGAAQIFVYDVNSAQRYNEGHVPGARHIQGRPTTDQLPINKDAMVVFYCGSERCPASRRAAAVASGLGYKNLWVMAAGIKGWEAAKLPVERGTR